MRRADGGSAAGVPAKADRRLLEEIQAGLPPVSRPFAELARRCGLDEEEALRRLERWSADGLLREVSAIVEPRRLGYRTGLVAARVPGARVEAVAARVSAHPGVSHNYLRADPWNLWFTLALGGEEGLEAEAGRLLAGEDIPRMVLPALRTFKIGVRLRPWGAAAPDGAPPLPGPAGDGPPLAAADRALLRVLLDPLPLVSRPWAEAAGRAGIREEELLARLGELAAQGVVRRVAGVLRHRQAGFTANGMACFRLPEEAIEEAGLTAAAFPAVSHCYRRETRPGWPYGLYAMIHARTRAECEAVAAEIGRRSGCPDLRVLYSVREFKKRRIRYL